MFSQINLTAEAEESAPNLLLPADYDIIWSAVCFVVLLLLFWRVVLPRLQKTLDERSEAIEGGIKKAEQAQAEAAAALESYNAQLAEARAEAAQIREQARTEAAAIEAELKAKANEDAARITTQAHQRIEAERQAAFTSLKQEVGSIAINLSEKVVGESLDEQRASGIVDRFLADLEAQPVSTQEAGR